MDIQRATNMKIIIEAEPKEIAALVLAVQERQGEDITVKSVGFTAEQAQEHLINILNRKKI